MSKIVRKVFFAWQLDKEKAFLEDMAINGYRLKRVSFAKYTFEEMQPKKLIYQFDFQTISKKMIPEYLLFFNDWEFIDNFRGWFYFVIDVKDKEPDYSIFNDNRSKRDMYKRLLIFLIIVGLPLYYQLIFFHPYLNTSGTTFPTFYFFLRIVVLFLIFLNLVAVVKAEQINKKLKESIVE